METRKGYLLSAMSLLCIVLMASAHGSHPRREADQASRARATDFIAAQVCMLNMEEAGYVTAKDISGACFKKYASN